MSWISFAEKKTDTVIYPSLKASQRQMQVLNVAVWFEMPTA